MYEQFQTRIEKLKAHFVRSRQRATLDHGPIAWKQQFANEEARLRTEYLRQGDQAESLKEFLNEFMKIEELRTLCRLKAQEEDPHIVQGDYRAALRFYEYMTQVMTAAKVQRQKGEQL